ncbi:MAG: proton-translocating NADH-quinone oxidoreductase, chain [Actinomycetia bacterium]|nr:proton-translocating NADH-quinone oxidoreductase, chain [Actinomycetes bacterium]
MIAQVVTPIHTPPIDWFAIAPEIALFAAAVAIVLTRALARRSKRVFEASLVVAAAGIVTSGAFTYVQWHLVRRDGPYQAIAGMVAVDGFSVFIRTVVLISLSLALLISVAYLQRERFEAAEYIALMMLSATGMMVMASANDLVVVFLALEILSMALYVLSAFDRRRAESQEAGLKYFLLGSFSSAVFLYGVALIYGATGTTSLVGIARFLSTTTLLDNGVLLVGMALLLVGLGFKVAAAPFHMWTPDVYQGAPTPVTAFMAAATKAAAFGAILRVFVGTFPLYRVDWRPALFGLAVLSLAVGTIAAVVQSDVKRMLAYSSISHAGYVLIGVQAATSRGTSAALFYLFVYALMIVGAFAIVSVVARRGDQNHSLDDYRGLARREPILAGLLTLFLLAQAGVPLTGGFVAKLGVFAAAVAAGQYALALIGTLAAVISAFVYLRIVLAMYAPADEAAEETRAPLRIDVASGVALFVAAAGVIALGVLPGLVLDFARDATLLLAK